MFCHSNLCSVNAHTFTHTHTPTRALYTNVTWVKLLLLHNVVLSWHVLLKRSWKQDWQLTQCTQTLDTLRTHTHTHKHRTPTQIDWAAEWKQLSAVELGRPAGVPNQASNKIKREEKEARSGHRRHPVWPNTNNSGCFLHKLSCIVTHVHRLPFPFCSETADESRWTNCELLSYSTVRLVNYIHMHTICIEKENYVNVSMILCMLSLVFSHRLHTWKSSKPSSPSDSLLKEIVHLQCNYVVWTLLETSITMWVHNLTKCIKTV